MTTDPNRARDGATTALQRDLAEWKRVATQRAEELERAEKRIDELTAELATEYERGRAVGREDVGKYSRTIGEIEGVLGITGAVPMRETVEAVRKLVTALAAARAAREQAEKQRDEWCRQCNMASEAQADALNTVAAERAARQGWEVAAASQEKRAEQAEHERDTALAREKTAERLLGEERLAKVAAETALASARTVLGRIDEWTHQYGAALVPSGADSYGEGMRNAKRQVAGLLTSSPAPVAAPSDERTKAECDYCHKTTLCSTTPGTGGGGLECDPPCAEVLAHTRSLLRKAYVTASADSEETPRYRATCRACATPLDRTTGAPVAAPCAGCAAARVVLERVKRECEPALTDLPDDADAWLKEHP